MSPRVGLDSDGAIGPGLHPGLHAQVGSWLRIADGAPPPRVKCTGNYVNNRAAEIDAKRAGFDGVIMLTSQGKVSEGSGACIFIVRNGRLITPDVGSDILESVTRDTVLDMAVEVTGLGRRNSSSTYSSAGTAKKTTLPASAFAFVVSS